MYADKATETKLVNAIKEAAQRIDYSGTDDPEAVLADCLLKQGLHDGFAKTAANAINKSYSVYYMSTHDDSDRDADHRLLDGDKVKVRMCKEDVPACPHTSKPADEPVIVSVKRVSTIGKAASEDKPEYTPRTFNSDKEYLDWLSNGLYKFANAFDRFYADTCGATEKIYGRHKEARDMDMDDYTVQCIMSHDHRDTNELLNTLGYTKKASKTAMFGTGKLQELPRIIPDNRTSNTIFSLVRDSGIIKTAHDSINYMLKEANDLKDCLVDIINTYENNCMTKSAAGNTGPKFDLSGAAGSASASLPSFAIGAMSGIGGGLANILENAAQAADSNRQGVSSSSVLDTNLLKEDRRVKNLEAWAEVASDPDLARYPITDLFEVTQKLIKANPQFERPDGAPMLVDTVKQVMSQGGSIGLAMHGATAKTLSDMARSRGTNMTGNDLYGIRSTITGKKEQGQYFNVSKLFTDNLQDSMDNLEKAPEVLKGVTKGIIDTGVGISKAITDAENNKLQRELEGHKIKSEIKKLKDEAEWAEQHGDEIKQLRQFKHDQEVERMRNYPQEEADRKAKEKERERREQEAYDRKEQEYQEKQKEKAEAEQNKKDEEARNRNIRIRGSQFINAAKNDPALHTILSNVPELLEHPDVIDQIMANPHAASYIAAHMATPSAGPNGPAVPERTDLARNIGRLLTSGDKYDNIRAMFLSDPDAFVELHPALSIGQGQSKGRGNK